MDDLISTNTKFSPCQSCPAKDKEINRLKEEIDRLQKELKERELKPKPQPKPQPIIREKRELKDDICIELASHLYEKSGHLQIMQEILRDTGVRNHTPSSEGRDNIPPKGSTVLYALVLSSDRFDDDAKKERLSRLIEAGVTVVVCLFRSGDNYIERENLIVNNYSIETIPFMVKSNKAYGLNLSHMFPNTSRKLDEEYKVSVNQLYNLISRPISRPIPQQRGFWGWG